MWWKRPKEPEQKPWWQRIQAPEDEDDDVGMNPYFDTPSEELFQMLARPETPGRGAVAEALEYADDPETEDARREEARRWMPYWSDPDPLVRGACAGRGAQIARGTAGPLRAELRARLAAAMDDESGCVRMSAMEFWCAVHQLEPDERLMAWAFTVKVARDPDPEVRETMVDTLGYWEGALPTDDRDIVFEVLMAQADGPDEDLRPPAVKALLDHRIDCPWPLQSRADEILRKYHAG